MFKLDRCIYMLGGIDLFGGQVSPIDYQWLARANGKPICIVDLTNKVALDRPKSRSIMEEHFSRLTDSNLIFVSELSSRDDLVNAIDKAGAIYIPGGDAEALLENIAKRGLADIIKSNKLPIVGNSAGAIALCRDAIITADEDVKETVVLTGLGLVPFSVDPHYNQTNDDELLALSKDQELFGLPEESGIIVEGESIKFVGSVWKFENGYKEKVN